MNKLISGVDYENGHVTGVTISGILEGGAEEPVTAYFRREEHGRWIRRKSCHTQTGFIDRCSVCQKDLVHIGYKTNFCPNCGAKMDGGAD